jgi:hypothetical protein
MRMAACCLMPVPEPVTRLKLVRMAKADPNRNFASVRFPGKQIHVLLGPAALLLVSMPSSRMH